MSQATDIKKQIRLVLEELVREQTLRDVQVDDFKDDPFARDFTAFPTAILMTPSIQGSVETNRDNIRAYSYDVIIVEKAENVTNSDQIEELAEKVLDAFDNCGRLGGYANAGLEPSATSPEAISVSTGRTYIGFIIKIVARALVTLTNP